MNKKFRNTVVMFIGMLGSNLVQATTDPSDPLVNHLVKRTDSASFTADGLNTGATEYGADEMVELSGSDFMEAKVFIKRYRSATGDEELRIYFSVHDIDSDPLDRIDFHFDRLHNHGSMTDTETEEDVLIRVLRTECATPPCNVNRITRTGGLFTGTGASVSLSNARIRASEVGEYSSADPGFQDGWTGEFMLTPDDLGWGYFPQDVGFLIRARSQGNNGISASNGSGGGNPVASYPLDSGSTVSETNAALWANLKLRYPIKYALVLDYSGSMLSLDGLTDNRWNRAKRAADLFAATLGLFKTDMLEDEISVSQYSWSCFDSSVSGNTTGAVQGVSGGTSLQDIDPPPTGTSSLTSGNTVDPAGGNCTPIQTGLEFALETQLSYPVIDCALTSEQEVEDRITLLLSDGFHNTPPAHVPFVPSSSFTSCQKGFTQVRTVALGPDGSAGTQLLSDIATEFDGGASLTYEAKYNQTNTFDDLLQAYLETLQTPLTINQVGKVGSFYNPGAPSKLVMIGVWNDPALASQLTVECAGGSITPDEHYENTHIGYAAAVFNGSKAYDCDNNAATTTEDWEITGATGGTAPDVEYVLADLRVLARFFVEQKPYAAGDPMLLQVRLKDMNEAITGADVTVEIAKPGEGLGNYLSTVEEDCSIADEIQLPSDDDDIGLNCHRLAAIPGCIPAARVKNTTTMAASATTGPGGDPIPGRYALADYHFDRCEKDGLDRDTLPGVKLYDDGTHGDLLADDGIYSLSYADTTLEGSYNFRFHVRGKTDDNVAFTRTRRLSQFVGIEPDEDRTEVSSRSGPVIGGQQTLYVYFLPRDAFGNYVGPGYDYKYRISVQGGVLAGDIQDLNNGTYMQTVLFPEGNDKPTVTIESDDGKFDKTVDLNQRPYELVPFLGLTLFDSALNLDNGPVLGLRLNYQYRRNWYLGLEAGYTDTSSNAGGDSGSMTQLFVNARYEPFGKIHDWRPYVSAGLGAAQFRSLPGDDSAAAFHLSVGATYEHSPRLGVRLEARSLNIQSVYGVGSTNNGQLNAGIVFRF